MYKPYIYSDSTQISFNPVTKEWTIKSPTENPPIVATEEGKANFFNPDTKETVIEFSGLASSDKREDRSWAKAIFPVGSSSPLHYHREREEIYYILTGQVDVYVDGMLHTLRAGEHLKIKKTQKHQVDNKGQETVELMVICSPSWIYTDHNIIAK